MKKDYEKYCWSCGSTKLVPDEWGVRCKKCGATWNKLPGNHFTSYPGHAVGTPDILPDFWHK